MGVALKTALGVAVGLFVTSEVPHDQGLVATGGEQHVGAMRPLLSEPGPIPPDQKFEMRASLLLKRGSQAGNPAIVALEGSAEDELLGHGQGCGSIEEP